MLQYLNETLGLSATETAWAEAKMLPQYLRSGRQYSVLDIDHIKLLLIRMESKSFNLTAFRKQLIKLSEYWSGEVVLCFEKLTAYQRKALVEQRISFVVSGSQLFLPCLGIVLQERTASGSKDVSRLSASSQYLLLYLLYKKESMLLNKAELANCLGVSAMNITRAVQELASLELVTVRKTGRSDYVAPAYMGKQLYEKAKPYLIDPVQRRVFVKLRDEWTNLPLSGESALAERTMLNMPVISCRAINRKEYKKLQDADMKPIDPAWYSGADYIELEVWKYDPNRFAAGGAVDIVSLAASFAGHKDERIAIAVDEMMEEYQW